MFVRKDDGLTLKLNTQKRWSRKRIIVSIIVLAVLIVLLDVSPVGGNMRFYTKWISCGTKPVATDTSLHIDGSQPHYYKSASAFPEFRGSAKFYCTPLQAEEAGYSASPNQYDFPAIEQYNQEHPSQKVHPGTAS